MSKDDIKLNVGQEELSIKASLIVEDEIRYIDNNMETIVDSITKQIISDKDLAIAQHIIQKLQQENEANKKRIEELEEERKLLNTEYVDNISEGQYIGINKLQYKEYLYLKFNSIPKAKVEEILEKEELPNVIVGGRRNSKTLNYGKKLGRIELCKELLKDGGE